jgi:hypothetical protein
MWKRVALAIAFVCLLGLLAVSAVVQREAVYRLEDLGGAGPAKALVLYHPSRDAHFSDDLSLALADGLRTAGFRVDRATLTRSTPSQPKGYALIAVVSNTYYWSPDLPTLHYLNRVQFEKIPVLGLMGGAGSTGRSERMLGERLAAAGGTVIRTQSLWLWRPNDEARVGVPNRQVALDLARHLGLDAGRTVRLGTAVRP